MIGLLALLAKINVFLYFIVTTNKVVDIVRKFWAKQKKVKD